MTDFKYMDDFMKNQYMELADINYELDKKLEVKHIKNGTILPVIKEKNILFGKGGVIDEKGNYVEISAQKAHNMIQRVNGKYDSVSEEKIDCTVIYMNFFYKHWGHFIIDVIPRMWYLLENTTLPIVFTVKKDSNETISGNYLEFLKLFGIDEKRIMVINKPTTFTEVIIPEMSLYPGKYYTKEYVKIFDKITQNIQPNEKLPEKLYLSRSQLGFAKRKEVGEKDIEKFFNENGYISISPEKLSLKEQIEYIKSAKEIVAVSGTLPHNMLFGQEGKNWIIVNKTYRINRHQALINQMKNVNVTYLDLHISLLPILYGPGPFIMTLNENAERFAMDNGYKIEISKRQKNANRIRKIWYILKYFYTYKKGLPKDNSINSKELYEFYKKR